MNCTKFPADFVTFTKEIVNGKLYYLCSDGFHLVNFRMYYLPLLVQVLLEIFETFVWTLIFWFLPL